MDKFWKAALAVGGVSAIGAFVFWSLYKDWLSLDIFSKMTSDQTFQIMIIFLCLTFAALGLFVFAYLKGSGQKSQNDNSKGHEHVFKLHESWEGVNEIDCDQLIGPDVTKAGRAMTITASSWLNGLVDKDVIIQNHFDDFETLILEMEKCEKVVPGYEKKSSKCKDFVSDEMRQTYLQMKNYKEKSNDKSRSSTEN